METQEAKLSSDADKAHEVYKQTLQELNAFQKEYETNLGKLLSNLQEMDESRSALMANLMRVYMDGHVALSKATTQINESCNAVVSKIDAPADLQKWIQSNTTNLAPEPLVEYEGYEPQFENASAEDVPKKGENGQKEREKVLMLFAVGKVFPKKGLSKGGAASAAGSGGADNGGKKLQRQKSLSRLLGGKSKVSSLIFFFFF